MSFPVSILATSKSVRPRTDNFSPLVYLASVVEGLKWEHVLGDLIFGFGKSGFGKSRREWSFGVDKGSSKSVSVEV